MRHGKKILFAPASNVLFHIGRCLGLARELRRRGHHIIFVGSPRYLQDQAIADPSEYEFYELPDFDTEQAMEVLRDVRKVPSGHFVHRMVEAELAALQRLTPDVVVVDFRLTMYIAARVQKVPTISLLLGIWMQPYTAAQPTIIRTYPQLLALRKIIGETATAWLTPLLLYLIIWHKTRPFRQVAKRFGQMPKRLLWDLLVGDYNLLLDTALWTPTKPLPGNFQQVGPVLWEPELPLPAWMQRLDPTRPVVYINFGSTAHRALFQRIFCDFAGTPYQVIVATGGQIESGEFTIPPNCFVEKFLPVGKIMERADLVIYHGGAGTAYQVMRAGVPSIVIATHLDQEYQGVATEAHQVGIFLTMDEALAKPGSILTATQRVLCDLGSYRAKIKTLQADLQRYNGLITAADRIERFVQERGL